MGMMRLSGVVVLTTVLLVCAHLTEGASVDAFKAQGALQGLASKGNARQANRRALVRLRGGATAFSPSDLPEALPFGEQVHSMTDLMKVGDILAQRFKVVEEVEGSR